jgi:hypothetical protein
MTLAIIAKNPNKLAIITHAVSIINKLNKNQI